MRKYLTLFLMFFYPFSAAGEVVSEGIFAPDRLKSVLGQDGVTPINIVFKSGEKATLWTFGDTILGGWKKQINADATLDFSKDAVMEAMPSNTLALTPFISWDNYRNLGFNFYRSTAGIVSEFIKYGDNPFLVRKWANDGIQIKNKIYIYYMDIRTDPAKPGDFDFKGSGLVVADIPQNDDINKFNFKIDEKFYIEKLLVGDSVIEKDGYVYVLGRMSKSGDKKLNSLFFARVKPKNIKKNSKYEFLNLKGEFKKIPSPVFDDVVGEASLAFDEDLKKFRIVYMAVSGEIKEAVFSNFKDIAFLKAEILYKPKPKDKALYYSAKEIFYDKEYVYMLYMDPSIYQPILIKSKKK